eukprot:CAMPEP_0168262806 /NCGR_PEP_ID=MMETSP0141_2-20121125/9982_1 /TAXON_ID=44445 /ORGANISM="Pseudo-nitzschia australis, Strain 10249 10 AB" /LENGTH=146 /DNA_ID=CAMNT_0008201393 /DNA_START=470 /DNA_END=911 /DNA_ORIENTATION=+
MERTESTESSSSSSLLSSLLPGIGSSQHYLDYDSDETEFETSLVEGLYTMAFTAHLVAWTVVASVVLTLLMFGPLVGDSLERSCGTGSFVGGARNKRVLGPTPKAISGLEKWNETKRSGVKRNEMKRTKLHRNKTIAIAKLRSRSI